jgi:hypothetical protein
MSNPQKDWVASWFPLMRENGEFTDIPIGLRKAEEEINWYFYPHDEYDGIGAIAHLLTKENLEPSDPPLTTAGEPGLWIYLKGILTYLSMSGIRKNSWSIEKTAEPGEKLEPEVFEFTSEEFQKIKEIKGREKITINSLLMFCINKAANKILVNEKQEENWWLIPMNLRGLVSRDAPLSNHASHVVARIAPNGTITQLHQNILSIKASGYQWGAWFFIHIGKFVGDKGMRNILNKHDKKCHSWCGSFSNLGVWKTGVETNHFFYMSPPVTKYHPIGIGLLTVNKQMTLSCIIHPCLGESKILAKKLLNEFGSQLKEILR